MPRRSRADLAALDALLRAHDNVVSLAELDALGVSRSTLAYRWGARGHWQRLLPGVVLAQKVAPTQRQRLRAALTYSGPGSVLTGGASLEARGIRSASGALVHVLVPHETRCATSGFVVVERTRRMPAGEVVTDLSHAPMARAALDEARRRTDLTEVRALLAEVVQRRRCTVEQLFRELREGPVRGSALPRLVLAEVRDGIRSAAEGDARDLVVSQSLPMPAWNVHLFDGTGRWIGCPDGYFEVGVAWQIDSYEWHLNPAGYRRTLERHSALTAQGLLVVHTLPGRLKKERGAVAEELRSALAVAAARPRPAVLVSRQRGGILLPRACA